MDVQEGTSPNNAEQDYTMAIVCWLLHSDLLAVMFEKPFVSNQLTSSQVHSTDLLSAFSFKLSA